jgi:hypothetical protein
VTGTFPDETGCVLLLSEAALPQAEKTVPTAIERSKAKIVLF